MVAAVGALSYAKEMNFELKLQKDRVSPGRQSQLEAIFRGAVDIPAPEIPFIDGLDIRYVESVKEPAGADKSTTGSVTHIYKVAAMRAGNFKIGPITFEHNGNIYRSGPVYLTSAKEAAPAEKIASFSEKNKTDMSDHIYLALEIPKTSIFVNERLPVILKLYSDWIDLEDIVLSEESSKTLIMKNFEKGAVNTVIKDGVKYAVLEYRSSFFAVTPGPHRLEPVRVSLKVARAKNAQAEMLNDNSRIYDLFIGDSETRTLELLTNQVDVAAMPLPSEGQPEDFGGAVGSFDFNIEAGPAQIKPGDTMTIKMVISGAGNYDTLSPPRIRQIDGIKTYEPRAVKAADKVTYEEAVRIDSADAKEIPAVTFSFFDPEKGRYASITKGPVAIRFELGAGRAPGKKAADIKAADKIDLKGRIVGLKDSPGTLRQYDMHFYRRKFFMLLWALPLIAILSATIIRKRLQFLRDNPGYAALLRASKKARHGILKAMTHIQNDDPKAFYENVFRIMQDYLGERLLRPAAGITEKVTEALRAAGVVDDLPERIRKLFSDCYLARYAALDFSKTDMNATLEELKYAIKDMDKKIFQL